MHDVAFAGIALFVYAGALTTPIYGTSAGFVMIIEVKVKLKW